MADKMTVEKVRDLLAGHCYQPLREAAEKWLDAADDVTEKLAKSEMIAQLKDAIPTVDEVIGLFGSKEGIAKFGQEMADKIKVHAEEIKAAGERFCDCDACTKAKSILDDLNEELADTIKDIREDIENA